MFVNLHRITAYDFTIDTLRMSSMLSSVLPEAVGPTITTIKGLFLFIFNSTFFIFIKLIQPFKQVFPNFVMIFFQITLHDVYDDKDSL